MESQSSGVIASPTEVMGKPRTPKGRRVARYGIVDHEILAMLKRIARKIANKFELNYKSITLMHPKDSEYGACWGYCDDSRNIVIDIRRGKRYQPVEEVVDTLIHELAHLGNSDTENEKILHNDEWRKRYDKYYYWLKRSLTKADNECLFNEER